MFTQEIFMCFFVFVIGHIFLRTLKKLNPFIMLFGLFVFGPVIITILGFDKWYYSLSLLVGGLSVFGNPFKFLGFVWTEITMGFQLARAKSQARRGEKENFERVNDEIRKQEREAEERLNRQKSDIEDELHRQRNEVEQEIRRKAEELRRREEVLKKKQSRIYEKREEKQRGTNNKKQKLNPMVLSDCYKILGVAKGLPLADYRDAWKGLVQQYHPDKTAHLGEELRKLAHDKTQELNRAWETIKKSK